MSDIVESLIRDLVEWVTARERTYEEVMDAWRTSCPRFPIWEDATDRGLVATEHTAGRSVVRITAAGAALLAGRRAAPRCDEIDTIDTSPATSSLLCE